MTRRTESLGSLLREEIANMLLREVKDPRLEGWLISVTDVRVSPDMTRGEVYVSLLGEEDADRAPVMKALGSVSHFLRRELGQRLDLRKVPELRFHLDESIERGIRLSGMLDELAGKRPAQGP